MWSGEQTLSSLERHPLFRVPFIERLHCIQRMPPNLLWLCLYFALCLVLLPPFPVVSLSGGQSVVKAQVLAGGRGKGYFTSGLEEGVQKAERCACVRVCVRVGVCVWCVCVCVCVCVCPSSTPYIPSMHATSLLTLVQRRQRLLQSRCWAANSSPNRPGIRENPAIR